MVHLDRHYTIKRVSTERELAELLVSHVWSSSTGFDLDGYLFLNASTSPDATQEYTVVRDGRRLESITIGVLDLNDAVLLITRVIRASKAEVVPSSALIGD